METSPHFLVRQGLTRREWLESVAVLSAALSSAACSRRVETDGILNVLVHGAFALDLTDTHLILRAPALAGNVYGVRAGNEWHAPKRNDVFEIAGLESGKKSLFEQRARQTYPHLRRDYKAAANGEKTENRFRLKEGLEYWTIQLPIPVDTLGFRFVEGSKNNPVLQGESLLVEGTEKAAANTQQGTPGLQSAPSIVLLTFNVPSGKKGPKWDDVHLYDVNPPKTEIPCSLGTNRSLSFYAEPAFPSAEDEIRKMAECFDPALKLAAPNQKYEHAGPYFDEHLGVSATDTRHLHQIVLENMIAGTKQDDVAYAGCLPLGL